MTTLRAALFDFDNTLVNTSSLRVYREQQNFAAISDEMIAGTRIYRPVIQLLRRLRDKGVKVGVVTNSPRRYVERVIAHHGLTPLLDVLVTYNEVLVAGKKPSPRGIELALEQLGIANRRQVIYVGDEYIDVVAAYRAEVLPVVCSWASRESVSTPPAADLCSASVLAMADDIEEMLPFAERCARHAGTDFERQAARFLPLDENADVATVRQKLKTFCLGRYFSQKSPTTAKLHDKHALSLEIARKDTVEGYRPPAWMADMLLKIAKSAGLFLFEDGRAIDVVTVIPRKPGKPERLEHVLRAMQALARAERIPIEFREDLLYFDGGAAKSLRDKASRERKAEQDAHLHAYRVDLRGKNVLVIDDVVTTGATTHRAIELLEGLGAATVHGVGIAKTVSIAEDAKPCPKCGRDMLMQKNKDTGERFWACSGYFADKACVHTQPLEIIPCPRCGKPLRLTLNRAKKTRFYGCTGWKDDPPCRYTQNA